MEQTKLNQFFIKLSKSQMMTRLNLHFSDSGNIRSKPQRLLFQYYYSIKDELKGAPAAEILEREQIFKIIFPDKSSFNVSKWNEIASELTEKIEDFLILQELKESRIDRDDLLIRSFRKIGMDKYHVKNLKKAIKKPPFKHGAEHHLHQLSYYQELYYKPQVNLYEEKEFSEYLHAAYKHNEAFYVCNRLKFSTTILIRKELYGEKPEEGFEENLQAFLDTLPSQTDPILNIYAQMAQLFLNPRMALYLGLKKDVIEYLPSLYGEKEIVLNMLISSLFLLDYPSGKLQEYFELYKVGIDSQVFVRDNRISPITFNNIIYVAHQLKEYAWNEKFVEEHVKYLQYSKYVKDNIAILYECYRLAGEKEYEAVLLKLDKILYEDYSYALRKYILLFKCTFELNKYVDLEELRKKKRSFTNYVEKRYKEEDIGERQKERNLRFMDLFYKIVLYPYRRYTKQYLIELLYSYNGHITEDEWLKDVIRKL